MPERVLSMRRIRGWVGAEPIRPRVDTRGYPEPQLRSSIRMARRWRLVGQPTSTAASQLSPNAQRCKRKRAFLFGICPGPGPGGSDRETSHRGVKPRMRRRHVAVGVSRAWAGPWPKTSHWNTSGGLRVISELCRCGTPGRIRTCGLQLRRLSLYPAELRAHGLAGRHLAGRAGAEFSV